MWAYEHPGCAVHVCSCQWLMVMSIDTISGVCVCAFSILRQHFQIVRMFILLFHIFNRTSSNWLQINCIRSAYRIFGRIGGDTYRPFPLFLHMLYDAFDVETCNNVLNCLTASACSTRAVYIQVIFEYCNLNGAKRWGFPILPGMKRNHWHLFFRIQPSRAIKPSLVLVSVLPYNNIIILCFFVRFHVHLSNKANVH